MSTLRSFSIVLAGTGFAAATMILSCSDSSAPSSAAAPTVESSAKAPTLTPQQSGTTNRLQAISPVSPQVAWASGVGGTFVLTTDGGDTWQAGVVPGAEALQFRDVEGVSAKVAYLMSAGTGADSRVYKTEDGGETWALQFQNEDPAAFYDCFAFWTPKHGITFSDAVSGRFPVIRTTDGETWQDIGDQLPTALAGEIAFAASGTCVTVQGGKRAWIATGGAAEARVLATIGPGGAAWSPDEGTTWVSLPGVLDFWAVAFASPQAGWLVGTEGRILKIAF